MRYFSILLVSAFFAMGSTGWAQTTSAQTSASVGSSNTSSHHSNPAMRQCMKLHLTDLSTQVKAHMEQFKAQNPGATKQARHQERHNFVHQLKQSNHAEIKAARQACHSSVGSNS